MKADDHVFLESPPQRFIKKNHQSCPGLVQSCYLAGHATLLPCNSPECD